jgi:hypothetical protein
MAAVGFVFAPLAPLVALAAAIVFWLGSFVYKYQLMFVYVTKVETGGVSHSHLQHSCGNTFNWEWLILGIVECRHQPTPVLRRTDAGPYGTQ